MKKIIAVIMAAAMAVAMIGVVSADEAAADYTQVKVFDGTYGFGDAEITVKTNDDMSAFDITFVCFDEDQELIGTITNGICMVSYDETGFVAGDCQQIWDDACASENAWEPIDGAAEEAAPAEEAAEEAPAEEAEAAVEEAPVPSVEGAEDVTVLMAGSNNVLVYWPENNIADSTTLQFTCTAPVFLVFGDAAFDADSAREYANESGLAEIAVSEGSSVVFVNPVEETWSDADAETYSNIVNLISDSSTSEHANGITEESNYFTGAVDSKITGTTQRIYVYGIGSGADYVAANILKYISGSVTYGDGVTIEFNNTIAGATLEGCTDASMVEESDIPVVSIGNSDEVNDALEANCGSVLVEADENYVAEYEEVIGCNRRQAGVLNHVYNWEEEGIVESVEKFTVTTSEDNVTFAGQAEHDVDVVVYYAEDLDVAEGNVPLVLCFHGGGNTALYEAQATAWPITGRENGFITASVDLHYPNCTATEIIEIINDLEAEYSIDASRIYASGFSMGGCQSWDLYEQYPEVFAVSHLWMLQTT